MFYRKWETEKIRALKRNAGNFDAVMKITPEMREDLGWWRENLRDSLKSLQLRDPEITLFTDATKSSWCECTDTTKFGGFFTEADKLRIADNINAYELLAIKLAATSLLKTRINMF